jgi:hypothetical protein
LDLNRLGGIMVDVFASSVVDHGFEPRSSQTESYQILTSISCFSDKHTILRSESKSKTKD